MSVLEVFISTYWVDFLFTVSRNRLFTSLSNFQARNFARDIHFSITKPVLGEHPMTRTVRLVFSDLQISI